METLLFIFLLSISNTVYSKNVSEAKMVNPKNILVKAYEYTL